MRSTAMGLLGLVLAWQPAIARAEEEAWGPPRQAPTKALPAYPAPITLGQPVPLDHDSQINPAAASSPQAVSFSSPPPLIRAQAPDAPPPPAPPPGAPPAAPVPPAFPGGGVAGGEEPYNCGVVTNPATPNTLGGKIGGFFSKCWDNTKQWFNEAPNSLAGIFQPGAGNKLFLSDHKFDNFTSPLTNPFFFEDPRALTEVRPIFMWEQTPRQNPIFAGGDNIFFGTQARVAFTDWLSLVINRFGGDWMEPHNPGTPPGFPDFASHAGFSEFWLGPKFTFLRNDSTGTLMAGGLTFQIPSGPAKVFQGTGTLGLVPYISFGQNFLKSTWGSFNFLNTTGFDFSANNKRSEFFYTNFHLDYDVGGLHRIYPLIELQWFYYATNGHNQPGLGFEGMDLYNFGSNNAGRNELILAIGARYKFFEWLQTGAGIQWGLLSPTHHLEGFRMTFDVIFRY